MKILENWINYDSLGQLTSEMCTLSEVLSVVCGKKIGEGVSRTVYEYTLNPNYVVKVCNARISPESNINEFQLWNEIRGLKGTKAWVKDWFAPVEWISEGGKVLLQRKTRPFHNRLRIPEKVPSFLFDAHPDNFGWIGDKFVCHDYGIIYGFINYNKRFKKTNWF